MQHLTYAVFFVHTVIMFRCRSKSRVYGQYNNISRVYYSIQGMHDLQYMQLYLSHNADLNCFQYGVALFPSEEQSLAWSTVSQTVTEMVQPWTMLQQKRHLPRLIVSTLGQTNLMQRLLQNAVHSFQWYCPFALFVLFSVYLVSLEPGRRTTRPGITCIRMRQPFPGFLGIRISS